MFNRGILCRHRLDGVRDSAPPMKAFECDDGPSGSMPSHATKACDTLLDVLLCVVQTSVLPSLTDGRDSEFVGCFTDNGFPCYQNLNTTPILALKIVYMHNLE